jgi:arylsulfatase A-like enzyme
MVPGDAFEPKDQGFDVDWPHVPRAAGPGGGYLAPWSKFINDPTIKDEAGRHVDERMADEAGKFIRATKGRPFFINFWLFSVHSPWNARADYIEHFKTKTDPANPQKNPLYAAMVKSMDDAVGRLLRHLEESGEAENTLLVFLSDNGASPFDRGAKRSVAQLTAGTGNLNYGLGWAHLSTTPFRHYKRNMANGGSSTAFIAHWPAALRQPGTLTDQPAHLIDLMATFVDISGAAWPAAHAGHPLDPLPGQSLRPIFAGATRPPHDQLFFHLYDHRAVIAGDLKLVSDWGRPWELYDLAADRTELRDLAQLQPAQAACLAQLWDDWAARAKRPVRSDGGEPIYRHLHDAQEKVVGFFDFLEGAGSDDAFFAEFFQIAAADFDP